MVRWRIPVVALVLVFVVPPSALAVLPAEAASSGAATSNNSASLTNPETCVAIALPVLPGMDTCENNNGQAGIPNNQPGGVIIYYLASVLKLASEAVAAVVLLMIVIAGVQYIVSGANPAQVKAAKDRLTNAIIALVLFLLMFAILDYLLPGGIL
jgi:type IV secretion system pilin